MRGLGSAIALPPSGSDDGLLTAEEIFDMKLQANLVVLSVCNTGFGRITGDGVIGLSRFDFGRSAECNCFFMGGSRCADIRIDAVVLSKLTK